MKKIKSQRKTDAIAQYITQVDDKLNRFIQAVSNHYQDNVRVQAETYLSINAMLGVLKAKGIFTDEELKVEFEKIQEDIKKGVEKKNNEENNMSIPEVSGNTEELGNGIEPESTQEGIQEGAKVEQEAVVS